MWRGRGANPPRGGGTREGGGQPRGAEELVVAGGAIAAQLVPLRKVAQFDLENSSLDGVKAGVPADLIVVVAAGHAVGAQGARVGRELRAGRGEKAGVSEGGEVLGGVEAERGGGAEGACGAATPRCAEGLGGVLDQKKSRAVASYGSEGVPVGALAVEVDGQDGVDVAACGAAQ